MYPQAPMGLSNPAPLASVPPPSQPTPTFIGVNASFRREDVDSIDPTSKKPAKDSPAPWSTSLCDCCEDLDSCCLTCWCPCIAFGRIAEMVDRGSTSCGVSGAVYGLILCMSGCGCLYSCFYRTKLRGQYFLKKSPCGDCCVHCCCEGCALCQEYRQLKKQGLDPSMGWHGNVERQKRLAAKAAAPTVDRGMLR
ncbi:hypothetical protein MLD38_024388 [Melastoma candidum]|uniref:Uncharacterized protein n=1 Tax=Melastoma candidum TaxID=119954 RepID=A0ACB9NSH4_9MYRT|nr:hypothetical protein MLD38_024388 [Melastoma candidum]